MIKAVKGSRGEWFWMCRTCWEHDHSLKSKEDAEGWARAHTKSTSHDVIVRSKLDERYQQPKKPSARKRPLRS